VAAVAREQDSQSVTNDFLKVQAGKLMTISIAFKENFTKR